MPRHPEWIGLTNPTAGRRISVGIRFDISKQASWKYNLPMTFKTKFWIKKHWTALCSSKSQAQHQRRSSKVSNACKWLRSYLNTNPKCLSLKQSLSWYPTLRARPCDWAQQHFYVWALKVACLLHSGTWVAVSLPCTQCWWHSVCHLPATPLLFSSATPDWWTPPLQQKFF